MPSNHDPTASIDPYASQRWRTAGPNPLRFRCWDGDYVVFSPLSGRTHLLEIVTGRILERIASEEPSSESLPSEIASFLEVENDDRVLETVNEILAQLEGAGLIERVR